MAIRNIDAIVKNTTLQNFRDSDFVTKYYNEALANQGQRNTLERIIGYSKFTVKDIFTRLNKPLSDDVKGITLKCKVTLGTVSIQYGDDNLEFYTSPTGYFNDLSNEGTNYYVIGLKFLMIIRELCISILNNEFPGDSTEREIYIPTSYEFEYIYDGVNETTIYGGNKDIYVYVLPSQNFDYTPFEDTIYVLNNQTNIKSSVYGFSMEIDTPIVDRKVILPYIDKSSNNEDNKTWWINGQDSTVPAEAIDAMNLNIVLLYCKSEGTQLVYEVLSGLHKDERIRDSREIIPIYIKGSDNQVFCIKVAVPTIINVPTASEETDEMDIKSIKLWNRTIANSTLIVLSNVNDCYINNEVIDDSLYKSEISKEDLVERYGSDGIITTLWRFNIDTNKYEPIKISGDTDIYGHELVLDLGRLGNFSSLIDFKANKINQIHPDNFVYRHLIFKNILEGEKHASNYDYIYPILQNIKGTSLNDNYINDFNFSLRYISKVEGEIGQEIRSTDLKNDSTFFKIGGGTALGGVTNSLYQYKSNNATNFYGEYIPNFNVPVFDLSEVLEKDSNVINRQNIISFDSNGQVYYSYFGTSFNELNKSILHLGTYSTNINLGNSTLLSTGDRSSFKTHSTLSIDFKNIYLNGNTTIGVNDASSPTTLTVNSELSINKNVWNVTKIDNNTVVKSMTIVPKFKYPPANYLEINLDNLSELRSRLSEIPTNNSLYLYQGILLYNNIRGNNYYYKHGDLLVIDNLLMYIFGRNNREEFRLGINTNITSQTNDIIKDGSEPKYLVSSSTKLNIQITANTINGAMPSSSSSEFYIGNPLDIIIVETNNQKKLIINEHRESTLGSIWRLPLNLSDI